MSIYEWTILLSLIGLFVMSITYWAKTIKKGIYLELLQRKYPRGFMFHGNCYLSNSSFADYSSLPHLHSDDVKLFINVELLEESLSTFGTESYVTCQTQESFNSSLNDRRASERRDRERRSHYRDLHEIGLNERRARERRARERRADSMDLTNGVIGELGEIKLGSGKPKPGNFDSIKN